MKKILIINASRNIESKCYKIINKIESMIETNKFSIEKITPNDYNLNFCTGCKECFETLKCFLDDEDFGSELKKKLETCDILLIIFPTYAHSIPADLKNIIDRLSYWLHIFKLIGKPTVVISTADTNGQDMSLKYLCETVSFWGVNIVCKETFTNIYNKEEAMDKIENIVNVINIANDNYIPKFTFKQEASFQNYKKFYDEIKNGEEYQYYKQNGYFDAESLKELYYKLNE